MRSFATRRLFDGGALGIDDSQRRAEPEAGSTDRLQDLEHDPEKWEPVFRKDHAQTKK